MFMQRDIEFYTGVTKVYTGWCSMLEFIYADTKVYVGWVWLDLGLG